MSDKRTELTEALEWWAKRGDILGAEGERVVGRLVNLAFWLAGPIPDDLWEEDLSPRAAIRAYQAWLIGENGPMPLPASQSDPVKP